MGRPKLTLKRIPNERERNLAFMKRKKGLIKKVTEFSSMCKADACLIICDSNGDAPPVTWPQETTKVYSIIEKYELAKNELKPPKNFDLNDFYDIRKNTVEAEISKVRKNTFKAQFPTWHPSIKSLGEEQLRNFIAILDTKLEACNQRINLLKNKHPNEAYMRFLQNMSQSQLAPYPLKVIDKGFDQSQMLDFNPNLMQFMAKKNGVVDVTSQVDVPVDCTNQIGATGNSTNQFDVQEYWTSELGEAEECSQLSEAVDITSATAIKGAPNYGTNFHVTQRDGNYDKPESSLCNYNGGEQPMQPCNFDPAMQNVASQFENVQQGAATIQPPLVKEFNIDDYCNMLQAELFNLLN